MKLLTRILPRSVGPLSPTRSLVFTRASVTRIFAVQMTTSTPTVQPERVRVLSAIDKVPPLSPPLSLCVCQYLPTVHSCTSTATPYTPDTRGALTSPGVAEQRRHHLLDVEGSTRTGQLGAAPCSGTSNEKRRSPVHRLLPCTNLFTSDDPPVRFHAPRSRGGRERGDACSNLGLR